MQYSKVTFNRILQSKQQFPISEERNVDGVISMSDNEATRTTFVWTKPALREDETEAENFDVEARLASRT